MEIHHREHTRKVEILKFEKLRITIASQLQRNIFKKDYNFDSKTTKISKWKMYNNFKILS